jgi:hypothetical protein
MDELMALPRWRTSRAANAYGRGVRAAAERLGAVRLANFDSHRWVTVVSPRTVWVCECCFVSVETGTDRPCTGAAPWVS